MAKTDNMEKTDKAIKTDNGDSKKSSQKNGAKQDVKEAKEARDVKEAKKERKQQTKREAKLMLKIESAKKDLQKAQHKIMKAQAGLNEAQGHLQELEEKMSAQKVGALLPADQTGQQNGHSEPAAMNAMADTNQASVLVEAVSPTPAVGNIAEPSHSSQASDTTHTPDQENSQKTEQREQTGHIDTVLNELPPEELQTESNNSSMPLITTDEHAWPPPIIREEVAEAVIEVHKNEGTSSDEPGNEPTTDAALQAEAENEESHPTQTSENTQLIEQYGTDPYHQE